MSNRINLGRVVGEAGQNGQDGAQGVRGEKGDTPYILNGFWWVGNTNTNVVAKGNEWFSGNDVPTSQGVNGDLYLRTTNGDVYKKENGVWGIITNIKGQQGIQGERGESALTFRIGSVTQGDVPNVTNSGTQTDVVLDFVIPKGEKGDTGDTGSGTTINVGGFAVDNLNFRTDPQQQIDDRLENNFGSENAGKLLQVGLDGEVVATSSGADNDVIDAYIVGALYTSDWLSEVEGGEALIPRTDRLYVVRSEGDYYMTVYAWDSPLYRKVGGVLEDGSVTYQKLSTELQSSIDDIDNKVDKVTGKGLSTNDYTTEEKQKLAGIVVPTKTSDLTNDSGFITNAVNDLANYYKKTETYTQSEVNTLIGNITTISAEVVATLPTASATTYFNTSKTIYLTRNSASSGIDYYKEYITLRSGTEGSYTYSWEKIGDTQIDLSGYVQTSRKVNNKALTSDITLDASDVGALPSNTTYVSSVNGSSGAITDIATTSQVNAKYTKPSGGIPKTDLASAVQTSLGLADSAVQVGDLATVATSGSFNDLTDKPSSVVVDNALSSTSENPVQNKVINTALNDKLNITGGNLSGWLNMGVNNLVLPINGGGIGYGYESQHKILYLDNNGINIGHSQKDLLLVGQRTHPKYNGNDLALSSEVASVTKSDFELQKSSSISQVIQNGLLNIAGEQVFSRDVIEAMMSSSIGDSSVNTTVATSKAVYDAIKILPNDVTMTGTGNAVTSASYDASTRKITFTKGNTFLTSAPVSSVAGYTGAVSAANLISAILTGTASYGDKISAKSMGANGYITFSSGLKIAWGVADHGSSAYDWTVNINYGIRFVNKPTVVSTPLETSGSGCFSYVYHSLSETGCTLRQTSKANANGKAQYVYWIAIGY